MSEPLLFIGFCIANDEGRWKLVSFCLHGQLAEGWRIRRAALSI